MKYSLFFLGLLQIELRYADACGDIEKVKQIKQDIKYYLAGKPQKKDSF